MRHPEPCPSSDPINPISLVKTQKLARDRYRALSWSQFRVPSSDSFIRLDTRDDTPAHPLPDENDGFTVVRQYLYDVLTHTGWGIGYECPAAIRATVEGWYGHGGYFKAQLAERNGLLDLCPMKGKDGEGDEVYFEDQLRDKIRQCVRYESNMLLYREDELDDAMSEADTCVGDNTPDISVQERGYQDLDGSESIYSVFRPSIDLNEDAMAIAPHENQDDDLDPSAPHLHRSDSARFLETVGSKTRTSKDFVSSDPEPRVNAPSEITHELTFQVPSPKVEQSKKRKERSHESSRALYELVAERKSSISRAVCSHSNATRPDSKSQDPPKIELPTAYKHARCGAVVPTEKSIPVARHRNHRKSAKVTERRLRMTHDTACSVSSTRYETLPESQPPAIKGQHLLVEATSVAKRAIALNFCVDEAKHLNHHERNKVSLMSRMFAKVGGKKA
ncbi:uncharacterized protein J4E84_005350 [Alternaria hordeiaustralica]|uniref:uncharacterized protein n=1 Tax=Alternaria hordeiaustralica TaxID=1187925 RepID=UPI0020C49FE6|nr:uncharacterized protein J4E84_005350 [Alternaria hordeiaustralica]KAI4686979.1 hypothetical protein J4E84_005350 [Alternaria hordeiaustralica]